MGLSSIYLTAILFALTTMIAYSMMIALSGYDNANIDLREHEGILSNDLKSNIECAGFNSTNTTISLINTTIYIANTGTENMKTGCVELFIDGKWVPKFNITTQVKPAAFDPGVWNPSERLLISALQWLSVGQHNSTVISCTGKKVICAFNASKCGDGVCNGGEYCARDSIDCDLKCRNTVCQNGCYRNLTATGEKDNFGNLICNETGGCPAGNCVCDGLGNCCGATGAHCTENTQCCAQICIQETQTCGAYPS